MKARSNPFRRSLPGIAALLLALCLLPTLAWAQRPGIPEGHAEYVRSNYTKFEYRVPVRDGTSPLLLFAMMTLNLICRSVVAGKLFTVNGQ